MLTESPHLGYPPVRPAKTARAGDLVLYLVVLLTAVLTFGLQSRVAGFEAGSGWVSAHTLAIVSRATGDNAFVGYTLSFQTPNGIDYYYFDRYPVFFSALFHLLLSVTTSLPLKVYLARQVMNTIFLSTLLLAAGLVKKLVPNQRLAFSAALISFSSYPLLYYKDMVHFDQPALLGIMLLLLAIAGYKLEGRRKPVYGAALVAVGLGRGYAAYPVLALWFLIELAVATKSMAPHWRQLLKTILRHDSFIVFVLTVAWGATLLSYNISIEAHKRNVSLLQTSVVSSAARRLSLNRDFNETFVTNLAWDRFTGQQLERVVDWSLPLGHRQLGLGKYLLLPALILAISVFLKRKEPAQRVILLLLVFPGFLWLFVMRNLAAFHTYTAMYYIGVPLVFYTALFSSVSFLKRHTTLLLGVCLLIFAGSTWLVNRVHTAERATGTVYTDDFDRIGQVVGGTEQPIYVEGGYRNLMPAFPYAIGFYLPEHAIAPLSPADYIISSRQDYPADNLTPLNQKVFLFKRGSP